MAFEEPLIAENDESVPELYRCFIEKPNQKLIKLLISKRSNKTAVFCEALTLASNQYKVGLVSTSLQKIRPSLQSTNFDYRSLKRPRVMDAVYNKKRGEIHVIFDVKVKCLEANCEAILEAVQGLDGWSCKCARDKLIISLAEDSVVAEKQGLTFRENNGVVQKGSASTASTLPVLPGSLITIRHRESKQLEVRLLDTFPTHE